MSAIVVTELRDFHPADWLAEMGLSSSEVKNSAVAIHNHSCTNTGELWSALWTGRSDGNGSPRIWELASWAGKRVAMWLSPDQGVRYDDSNPQTQPFDQDNYDLVIFSLSADDAMGRQLAARVAKSAVGIIVGPSDKAGELGFLLALSNGHVVYPPEPAIDVADIAPTVLSLLGVAIPETMPGHALAGLFDETDSDDELTAEEIALLQTHLMGLGYLG